MSDTFLSAGISSGLVVVFSCVFLIGIFLEYIFLSSEKKRTVMICTLYKGLASLCFVAVGVVCLLKNRTMFGILLEIGLVFGLLGDVFLNLRHLYSDKKSNQVFAVGIAAFLFGHFMYMAALISLNGSIIPLALLVTALIVGVAIPLISKYTKSPSKGLRIFGFVYFLIVVAMFACGLSFCIKSGFLALGVLFAVGALLFMVSDFLLIYYSFTSKSHPIARKLNLYSYYIGQTAIALCILIA